MVVHVHKEKGGWKQVSGGRKQVGEGKKEGGEAGRGRKRLRLCLRDLIM